MINSRLLPTLIAVGLSVVCMGLAKADHPENSTITPSNGVLVYPAESGKSAHPISIKSSSGVPLYDLSLEPDFNVGHHTVVLNLVLRKPGEDQDAPNLFDPTGGMHGYQKHIFAAPDFAHGAVKSIYGKERTLDLDPLGIEVRLDVETASVDALPASAGNDGFEFKRLVLEVEIGNRKR